MELSWEKAITSSCETNIGRAIILEILQNENKMFILTIRGVKVLTTTVWKNDISLDAFPSHFYTTSWVYFTDIL